jgi:hypothetical protein
MGTVITSNDTSRLKHVLEQISVEKHCQLGMKIVVSHQLTQCTPMSTGGSANGAAKGPENQSPSGGVQQSIVWSYLYTEVPQIL